MLADPPVIELDHLAKSGIIAVPVDLLNHSGTYKILLDLECPKFVKYKIGYPINSVDNS